MARSRVTQLEVEGIQELQRRLDYDQYEPALRQLIAVMTDYVATEERRRAPRRTGRLAGSFTEIPPRSLAGEVRTDVRYARFVEYGTTKTPARRFMRLTINAARRQLKAATKRTAADVQRIWSR